MGDYQKRAPEAIPATFEALLNTITKPARNLMDIKGLPYSVQSKLAEGGYVTIEDLGDRWDTPEKARAEGPRALDFEAGNHGFTSESTAFTAMKLYQVVRGAQQMSRSQATGSKRSAQPQYNLLFWKLRATGNS